MLPELITKAPPDDPMSTTSRRATLIAAGLVAAVLLLPCSLYTAAFDRDLTPTELELMSVPPMSAGSA